MQRTKTISSKIAKRNGLLIGIAVAVVFVTLGILKEFLGSSPSDEIMAKPQTQVEVPYQEEVTMQMKVKERLAAEKREKALTAIAEHEKIMSHAPGAEDTPDRAMAIGNLYQYQIGDYYSAIKSYRNLVDCYPTHSQTPQAYVELATCYERLGDQTQANFVYREMVEKLDPSLQHTQFAKKKLAGE